MKKAIVVIAVAVSMFMFHPCCAQINQCSGSLQGIQSIGVVVGDAPLTGNVDFLSQIKADVEGRLKTAGINVYDLDVLAKPKDKRKFFDTSGFLEINFFMKEFQNSKEQASEPRVIYTILLVLRQRIELDRNDVKCLSPTWVEGSFNVTCQKSELEESTRKNISNLVGIFLDAYTAENPKQTGKQ
jgi:hypothetical protein